MTQPDVHLRPHRRDVFSGAITAVGGLILFTAAQRIERLPGDTETIGPATFPTALSAILIGAGLMLCVSGFRKTPDPTVDGEALRDDPPVPPGRLLLMIVLFAGYCAAFIPVGFLLSTFAYLALVSGVVDAARWKRNVLFALGFSAVVYLTFTRLLAVELPAGILG
ncbi:MAG: tripartite tricarboxylate transporter TctB family protein [Mycobacterium sp.]